MSAVVLDACAILSYLRDEDGADMVELFLIDQSNQCLVHAVNLCEIFYDILRSDGESEALKAVEAIKSLGIMTREDMDEQVWQAAGHYKVNFRIALGDCFALALAKKESAKLVTSDRREFERVNNSGLCSIIFIRN